ncbi:hypothetical protein GDO81_018015 [Engystomops pustulosus]|uniref:Uncharacterized protein n=1 Tax=Engystomops pustulosus TaxID=76066 RepID=A0AAV7A8Z4_ENGPU|nr:hypothetical protein GDO81_018015 [Engystomops pustulosus]
MRRKKENAVLIFQNRIGETNRAQCKLLVTHMMIPEHSYFLLLLQWQNTIRLCPRSKEAFFMSLPVCTLFFFILVIGSYFRPCINFCSISQHFTIWHITLSCRSGVWKP